MSDKMTRRAKNTDYILNNPNVIGIIYLSNI